MNKNDEWKMSWFHEIGYEEVCHLIVTRAAQLAVSDDKLDETSKAKGKFIMLAYRCAVEKGIPIPKEISLWVARGFERYLKGEESTLNAAFNVNRPSKGCRRKVEVSKSKRDIVMHILVDDYNLSPNVAAEMIAGDIPINEDLPPDVRHFVVEGRVNPSSAESILQSYYRNVKSPPTALEKLNAITNWSEFDGFVLGAAG